MLLIVQETISNTNISKENQTMEMEKWPRTTEFF